MHTFQLTLPGSDKPRTFSGPSNWDELSPTQAVALMRFRSRVAGQLAVVFPVLDLLYGFKPKQLRWLFDERFLKKSGIDQPQQLRALELGQALINALRWSGQTQPGPAFLVPCFRRFSFRYGTLSVLLNRLLHSRRFYAPEESLANLSFEEFMYAEKAYRDQDFALLAAILYRPKKRRQRIAFDNETVNQRAAWFSELEPALLALIVLQYEACQQYLQKCFPLVFPKKITPETSTQKADKPAGNWLEIAISMAKLDVTKIRQIEQTNLYLALKVLDEQIRQAQELEDQLEKMKKK